MLKSRSGARLAAILDAQRKFDEAFNVSLLAEHETVGQPFETMCRSRVRNNLSSNSIHVMSA